MLSSWRGGSGAAGGAAPRLGGGACSPLCSQPESPTDTQMGRVWGPGSSEGAGAAAAKASSTPRPRAPPPAAPPLPLPVALQRVLGEAPCGEALCAGLGAVLLVAVLEVLDDVPHVAWLDWKWADNDGRLPPAGRSPLQPRTGPPASPAGRGPGARESQAGPSRPLRRCPGHSGPRSLPFCACSSPCTKREGSEVRLLCGDLPAPTFFVTTLLRNCD